MLTRNRWIPIINTKWSNTSHNTWSKLILNKLNNIVFYPKWFKTNPNRRKIRSYLHKRTNNTILITKTYKVGKMLITPIFLLCSALLLVLSFSTDSLNSLHICLRLFVSAFLIVVLARSLPSPTATRQQTSTFSFANSWLRL